MKSPEKPIVTQALLYWSGAGNRTRVYYGANAVQPAFGNASPNHCIQMGSSPAQNIITGIPRWDIPVIGAGDRTRTGTPSLAVDFESCSHLALSCLLWPLAAVLETAKTLVLQRILDAPTGIDQLHIRKNQSSN